MQGLFLSNESITRDQERSEKIQTSCREGGCKLTSYPMKELQEIKREEKIKKRRKDQDRSEKKNKSENNHI